jgi:hypothetical protein
MYGLVQTLRVNGLLPSWLRIGGRREPGEIPWFWSWKSLHLARAATTPWIGGPNLVFQNAYRVRRHEVDALSNPHCAAYTCHSHWYANRVRKAGCTAPIRLLPYPTFPPAHTQGRPELPVYSALVYIKRRFPAELLATLMEKIGHDKCAVLAYGTYTRDELFCQAGRSTSCVFLSGSEHGSIAQTEILQTGCPLITFADGGPYTDGHPEFGYHFESWSQVTAEMVARATLNVPHNRWEVRRAAIRQFGSVSVAKAWLDWLACVSTTVAQGA